MLSLPNLPELRYLLLQIRDADDPIGPQEVVCFAKALDCQTKNIATLDLLGERLSTAKLDEVDAVLIGGSGNYSAAGESEWLENVFADLRLLSESRKPTFASCWGFQAIARALGGRCIHDPDHAELGTIELKLTAAGRADSLFGELGECFLGLAGHEDRVVELPPGAVLLASSALVAQQAFKLAEAPIYCTQFHPELELKTYLERVAAYPQYVEKIAGTTLDEFAEHCQDTPQSRLLLKRFAQLVARHVHE
ncbi:MAG: type 1 glutamine amidotransferase [Planctomycetes bacterium]|nr:type 1 glutamine amidotransferase [Planctomycetota bacterium]